jgi:hypothetical protein
MVAISPAPAMDVGLLDTSAHKIAFFIVATRY